MYPSSDLKLNFEDDRLVTFFTWTYEPLSNWSAHAINVDGERYATVEHAYQAAKYLESNPAVARDITAAGSPWAAIRVDRAHKHDRRADWHEVKVGIMRDLLLAKYAQHEDVRDCLAATGSKRILEFSPVDRFWGGTPSGEGENMMGRLWMEIRGGGGLAEESQH